MGLLRCTLSYFDGMEGIWNDLQCYSCASDGSECLTHLKFFSLSDAVVEKILPWLRVSSSTVVMPSNLNAGCDRQSRMLFTGRES